MELLVALVKPPPHLQVWHPYKHMITMLYCNFMPIICVIERVQTNLKEGDIVPRKVKLLHMQKTILVLCLNDGTYLPRVRAKLDAFVVATQNGPLTEMRSKSKGLLLEMKVLLKEYFPVSFRIGVLVRDCNKQLAVQQLLEYTISRTTGFFWHLDHSNHWRGSLDHTWDSVPDTWRLHELLLQDWLKWHVNAKEKCDGAGLLCILTVQRSGFTHPAVCCEGIRKCIMKSAISVDSGEISGLLCKHGVDTQFSFIIGNTSEIATLQRHIKGIGALQFQCAS